MLKVSHICKTFTGGIIRKTRVDAVKDVSFTICNGETFGIVGNSGCGKSTIANMLLSVIKPDSGTIEIDGTIQIIFQHPETSLDPAKRSVTVWKNRCSSIRCMTKPGEKFT